MKHLFISSCTLALAAGFCATEALAQTATASSGMAAGVAPAQHDSGKIEEVIVTAQRRAESAQKAALSLVVIKPAALAAAGITNVQQLTSIVPSLQIGNGGAAASVYLRGVGSYQSSAAQSPAIPFYTDGVYDARTESVASEFYDVDRLEVLKGPQGTLYGRNASGGAINILTVNPVLGRYTGHADFELGNYSNKNGEAAINLPLGPTLALRVSGQVVDKGGYSSIGLGDDVHQAVRAKLLWQPSDRLSVLLNGSYGHIGGYGQTFVMLNKNVPGWYPWLDSADPRSIAYTVSHAFAPIPGFVIPPTKADARQNLNFYNISATIKWDFGPAVLTVIPAYRKSSMQNARLFSFLYQDGYGLGDQPAKPETSEATSVEARLSGNSERLKWVAGLYYFNEDQFQQATVDYGLPINVGSVANYGTRSYAAFGQATYSVVPHFRLIGGLRYTSDERSISNGAEYFISPTLFLGPPPPAGAACGLPAPTQAECIGDSFSGNHTFTNVSWKGGFEADLSSANFIYATVSRGFKAGGYNTQSVLGAPGQAVLFNPEVLTAYEAGLKNRLLDDRVRLNVSGFYWDYKGHQEPRVGFTNSGTTNLIYYNAGAMAIYGGTVELVAKPWPNGTFNTYIEYAHSRYTNFNYLVPSATFNPASTACIGTASGQPGLTNVDCTGFQAARTPSWTGNIGYTHDFPIGDSLITASTSITFASSRWLAIDFTPIERAKAYATVDAYLTYHPPGDRWSFQLFGRNLNNGTVYTQATSSALSTVVVSHIDAPRTYGARVSVNF